MTPTLTPEVREYRKTATIMAVQYLGQHVDGVCRGGSSCQSRGAPDHAVPHIHTLEGDLTVSHYDWIATGVQGEHWAIKPDVFAATYALAASPQPVVAPSDLIHDLAMHLGNSIAELGYPVGMGLAPSETACTTAAQSILDAYGQRLSALHAPSDLSGEDGLSKTIPTGQACDVSAQRYWVILQEPRCVPDRKGPWKSAADVKDFMREVMDCRPTAQMTVLTVDEYGEPSVQHGGEWLQMADGRSSARVKRHNASCDAALTDPRVRSAIVQSIAFINRDQGTDRIDATLKSLMPMLVEADKILRDPSA